MAIVWLLFVLSLLAFAGLTPTETKENECEVEYLLAMEDKTDGIEISLFQRSTFTDGTIIPETEMFEHRMVQGHHLPPECGAQFSRCQDLLIESSLPKETTVQHIVFIPLVRAVLLLELTYNTDLGKANKLEYTGHYIVDSTAIRCSPTAMYKILKSFYAVCMDLETGYISVIEIKLLKSQVGETTTSGPLIEYKDLPMLATVTNFVYVNGIFQYIVFGLESVLYILDPIEYSSHTSSLIDTNCSSIQEIATIPGSLSIIAYCANGIAVYYALDFKDWYFSQEYATQGIPYVCSSSESTAAVFADAHYVQYQENDTRVNIDLQGTHYNNGICFQSGHETFFAYNDLEKGAFVIDLKSSKSKQFSDEECFNSQCRPLRVINDRFLIIREILNNDGNVIVVENVSQIINAKHTMPDLVTVVHNSVCAGNVPSFSKLGLVLGLIISVAIIFIIIIILIVVFMKRRGVTHTPMEETGDDAKGRGQAHKGADDCTASCHQETMRQSSDRNAANELVASNASKRQQQEEIEMECFRDEHTNIEPQESTETSKETEALIKPST